MTRRRAQSHAPEGYSSQGLGVVPSASNPGQPFVYAINHRKPIPAKSVGADSVVEIFETTVGGNTPAHLKTIKNPVISIPNDIIGAEETAQGN